MLPLFRKRPGGSKLYENDGRTGANPIARRYPGFRRTTPPRKGTPRPPTQAGSLLAGAGAETGSGTLSPKSSAPGPHNPSSRAHGQCHAEGQFLCVTS